eukprot:TRINITY_DN30546_c0_g1_i1.p1 TRINITY_DN30546_c0_g1~~TRINITY_DN30546_c0_g1_i1.p1  ORF type:complete len:565 (+),score=169.79 TRINITY_DN30546_c0_g1_i1:44-1696(+)
MLAPQPTPALPPAEEWPQRPLMLRCSPKPGVMHTPGAGAPALVNTHESYPFETDLFKGHFHLSVRYAKNAQLDPWQEGQWMHGKNRKVALWVQGEFKKRLRFDEVYLGFVWDEALAPPRGSKTVMDMCDYFSPGTIHDICSDKEPYVLNLLAGAADAVHMWQEGEPPADKLDPKKPTLVPERNAGGMPNFNNMKQRAKWMHKKNKAGGINAEHHHFEPGWTYTFDFYTHTFHLHDFELHVPLGLTKWKVHLEEYLSGQHYPLIARTRGGSVLWSFELWHEKSAAKDVNGQNAWQRLAAKAAEEEQERKAKEPVRPAESAPSFARIHDTLSDRIGESMRLSSRTLEEALREPTEEDTLESCESEGSQDSCGTRDEDDESQDSKDADGEDDGMGLSSPAVPRGLVSIAREGQMRVFLWKGKRLRKNPKHSSSWVTKKNAIPQGCAVRVTTVKGQYVEVELPSGQRGWTPGRNLGTHTAKPLLEPQVAIITARRKRLRAEPRSKAKRHGSHMQLDEEVDVLDEKDGWVLVHRTCQHAGWVKRHNLKILASDEV